MKLSKDVIDYCNMLVGLHNLMIDGKGGTTEADELRERMDDSRLTDEELEFVKKLSASLYQIRLKRLA